MRIVSDKDLRVAMLSGAVVLFEAGVAREISEEIGLVALQMGAKEVSVDTPKEPVISEPPLEVSEEVSGEVTAPEEDDSALLEVMNQLIKEGDPESFKSDGTPKAAVVNRMAGRTVRTEERDSAWQKALNAL